MLRLAALDGTHDGILGCVHAIHELCNQGIMTLAREFTDVQGYLHVLHLAGPTG